MRRITKLIFRGTELRTFAHLINTHTMKTRLLAVLLSFFVSSITYAQSITVTSPNGGEVWAGCTSKNITWTASGTSNNYTIDYSTDGGTNWTSVTSSLSTTSGSFTWTVPNINSSNCLVRVKDSNTPSIVDQSNSSFTITAPLILTAPNGGEKWEAGTVKSIRWAATGTSNRYKIEYSTNAGTSWNTITSNTYNTTGIYNWTVVNSPSTTALVRVTDYSTSCMTDKSNNVFTIDPPTPTLALTYPNGNNILYSGKSYNIRWSSSNLTSNLIALDYTTDSGKTWTPIVTGISNTGSHSWTVPNTPSTSCLIKVKAVGTTYKDSSNAYFTIKEPFISVFSPNGNENWEGCESKRIQWSHNGTVNNRFNIKYSTDNGSSWTNIATNYFQSSSTNSFYNWSVPNGLNGKAILRVEDASKTTTFDESDTTFNLSPNSDIIVTSPVGGESWEAGKTKTITWVDNVSSLHVYYSSNSGTTWSRITSYYGTSGNSINWSVPNAPGSNYRIKVEDRSASCKYDISDSDFTVTAPTPIINVTAPNGNSLYPFQNYTIRWSSAYLTSSFVKIEYSTDSMSTWKVIQNVTNNDGAENWTVPKEISNNCFIRVSEYNNSSVNGVNTTPFKIVPAYLNLTSPSGGESWKGCESKTISWSVGGGSNSYRIEYSLDTGKTWNLIATRSGTSYSWSIPAKLSSSSAKIRVRDLSRGVGDTLSGTFGLVPNTDVIVTTPNGGEHWEAGINKTISWVDNVSSLHVYYSANNGSNWTRLTSYYGTSGNSLNWNVVNNPGSNYLVKVEDRTNTCKYDISDSNFTVDPPQPVITVTSPNGGSYYPLQSHSIRWTSAYLTSSFVNIDFSSDSGATWSTVVANTSNDGSHSWTFPNVISDNCFIRVSEVGAPSVNDLGNKFKLLTPFLNIVTPNGGDVWKGCETKAISWSVGGGSNSYRLEYSLDTGKTWTYITNRSGTSYNWTIPAKLSSSNALIRVKDNSRNLQDQSDAVMAFIPNTDVVVLDPNGGEKWEAGKNKTIRWVDNVSSLHVYYSSDKGSTWNRLSGYSGTSGTSQNWSVINNPGNDYLIKVEDRTNTCKYDISDSTFSVTPPQPVITVTAPNSGSFYPYQSYNVRWTSAYLTSSFVSIEFSSDSMSTWSTVASVTNDDGSHSYSFPNTISSNCFFRVSEYGGTDISDTSGQFSIIPAHLTLNSPNGGEVWKGCESKTISWTVGGGSGTYRLEYSLDSGNTWNYIINRGGSSYSWALPAKLSSSAAKIRVRDLTRNLTDESNGYFSFIPNTDIIVTSPNGGEYWEAAKNQTITWVDNVSSMHVYYSANNGSNWTRLTSYYGTSGTSLNWNVVNNPGSNYLVKVEDRSNTCKYDISDSSFTVDPPKPRITVTTPNGGTYYPQQTFNIRWTSAYLNSSFVNIEFTSDSGSTWLPVAASTTNDGSHSWTVPDSISTNCFVRVSESGSPNVNDIGNKFRIAPASITLTEPNGGQLWKGCENQYIRWNVAGGSGSYRLEYSLDSGSTWNFISNSGGSAYYWTNIPAKLKSNKGMVRVQDLSRNLSDASDATMRFVENQDVIIASPNGGEQWEAGTNKTLSWVDNLSSMHVYYSNNNGSNWTRLTGYYGTSGTSLNWNVVNNPGSNYLIKVEDRSNTCKYDVSDTTFTVLPPVPSIAVTYPNTAVSLYQSQSVNVRWTSSYLTSPYVRIDYSLDSGLTWNTITNVTNNDGSHNWTVPSVNTSRALIRVSEYGNPSLADISNSTFTIKPSIILTAPNGGSQVDYRGCTVTSIKWEAGGTSNRYIVDYTLNGGTTWNTINSNYYTSSSTPQYNWTMPNTASQNVKVRVRDRSNSAKTDESDYSFAISAPITLNIPNYGGTYYVGDTMQINWNPNGTSNYYNIDYSTNGGTSWTNIAFNFNTSGSTYSWVIPGTTSNNCLVRVTDNINTCKKTQSVVPFKIVSGSKKLVVTAPNGGESWTGCSTQQISWTNSASSSSYKIEYSANSGQTWTVIQSAFSSASKTYNWKVPSSIGNDYLVRVSDASDATVTDQSDSSFSITNSTPPVISANGSTTICTGSSVSLSCNQSSGIRWYPGGLKTQSITVTTPGSYYVIQSDSNGCNTQSNTIVVNSGTPPAKPTITASGATKFCLGGSVILSTNQTTGIEWYPDGQTSQTITATKGGAYTATYTDGSGCSSTSDPLQITTNSTPTINRSSAGVCLGDSLVLSSSSSSGNVWFPTGDTTQTIKVSTNGNYKVQVTDSDNCVATSKEDTVLFLAPPAKPTITAMGATSFCKGDNVRLVANPVSNVTWSTGIKDSSITVDSTSTITVSYQNAGGCASVSDPINISLLASPAKPVVSVIGDSVICNGDSLTLASNAANNMWSDSSSTNTIVARTSGYYSTTTTGGNGCKSTSDPVLITVNPIPTKPTVSLSGDSTFCAGDSVLLISNQPLGNKWSNGDSSTSILVKSAGSYTVKYTNQYGCDNVSKPINVAVKNAPVQPTVTANGSATFCSGDSITLSSSFNGNVIWSNGDTTNSIVVNNSGNYSVKAISSNGCSSTSSMTSVQVYAAPLQPSIVLSDTGQLCIGDTITLSSSISAGNYWSTGDSSSSIKVYSTGTYALYVKNSNGCKSATSSKIVTFSSKSAKPSITVIGDTLLCSGDSTILSTSAVNPKWSTGVQNGSIVIKSTGLYSVTTKPVGGCENVSDAIFVRVNSTPAKPIITVSGDTNFCIGDSVTLTANSNAGIKWNTADTSSSITVKRSGAYSVKSINQFGCESASDPITVVVKNAPAVPVISANGSTTFCEGGNVLLSSSAGINNTWSNSDTNTSITVTQSGSYSVLVTGNNGCESISAPMVVTVNTKPVKPQISLIGDSTFCSGDSVTLVTNYSNNIKWSNGDTVNSVTAKTSGIYSVEYENNKGCKSTSDTKSITVFSSPVKPTISASGPLEFCDGNSVTLNSSSASDNKWSTNDTSNSIVVTATGNYNVKVENANGCSANSQNVFVKVNTIPLKPVITINGDSTFCSGDSVTLVTNYSNNIKWSNGDTVNSVKAKTSGIYSVEYVDANGCKSTSNTKNITVYSNPAIPVISASGPLSFCDGGSVNLNSSSAVDNKWSTGDTANSITARTSGNFNVKVVNSNGCEAISQNVFVKVFSNPNSPTISLIGDTTFCAGDSLTLVSSVNKGIRWSTGDTTSPLVQKSSGSISLTYTDTNNCSAVSRTVQVVSNPLPQTPSILAAGSTTFCDGNSVTLNSSSASNNKWSTSDSSASITVKQSGNFSVTAYNQFGCEATSSNLLVTVNPLPAKPAITASGATTICQGDSVILSSSSLVGNQWSTADTTNSIIAKSTGAYSLKIVDSNRCESPLATMSVLVNAVPSAPIISASGPTGFCQGDSVKLTSSVINGNNWSQGDTVQSITVKNTGSYSVKLVNSIGCEATSNSITVNVGNLPATPTISSVGSTSFCSGDSAVLVSSSTFGNRWSTGDTTNSIIVRQPGNYSLSIFDNGCNSNNTSESVTVFANPIKPIITFTGDTAFCPGDSVLLHSSYPTRNMWSHGGGNGATIAVNSSGSYTVTYTDTNGCFASSSPLSVRRYPAARVPFVSPGGSVEICEGESIVLSSDITTGLSWDHSQSPYDTVLVSQSGSYFVNHTDGNGCQSVSNTVTVSINPKPTPTTISQIGQDLVSTNASAYQWYVGGAILSGEIGSLIRPKSNGVYQVETWDGSGCKVLSAPYTFTSVGIANASNLWFEEFKVFPNPSNGKFTIELNLLQVKEFDVEIINTAGKTIYEENIKPSSRSIQRNFTMESLPAGMYQLMLTSEQGVYQERLIIQH